VNDALALLRSARQALRSRFDDFRRALDRRDEAAYRMALADFHERLRSWTEAEERALLPALGRAPLPGRDATREVRLEHVQLRELTRHVLLQIDEHARMSDVLGFVENLSRRFGAHEAGMLEVYYPAAAPHLSPEERAILEEATPPA
jgi:hypothetical protein